MKKRTRELKCIVKNNKSRNPNIMTKRYREQNAIIEIYANIFNK